MDIFEGYYCSAFPFPILWAASASSPLKEGSWMRSVFIKVSGKLPLEDHNRSGGTSIWMWHLIPWIHTETVIPMTVSFRSTDKDREKFCLVLVFLLHWSDTFFFSHWRGLSREEKERSVRKELRLQAEVGTIYLVKVNVWFCFIAFIEQLSSIYGELILVFYLWHPQNFNFKTNVCKKIKWTNLKKNVK